MTTEELVATGLPALPFVEGPENAPPPEDGGSPAASGSRSHEDGEVRTDDEDVEDVDAGIGDLVKARAGGPLPPSLVFGESKVTTNMIREYEVAWFFPSGTGRAPLDEQVPAPEDGRLSCFGTSSPAALGFILDAFSVKIHQLSPTSFLEVSKFIWIMKTLGRNLSVDAFARFFELVIVPDVIKIDDGQFYEAQHACCTFNTRRQNTTRIQIAPCCKTNLTDD
jgi:hypothetical protein